MPSRYQSSMHTDPFEKSTATFIETHYWNRIGSRSSTSPRSFRIHCAQLVRHHNQADRMDAAFAKPRKTKPVSSENGRRHGYPRPCDGGQTFSVSGLSLCKPCHRVIVSSCHRVIAVAQLIAQAEARTIKEGTSKMSRFEFNVNCSLPEPRLECQCRLSK
ncbi:hypothetical protein SISSUDRAFT_835014 [Sistotremastrum suecicum HHB10207 ss-3]|uniref:Uncharacterized protein n=1 Tax=Sistotremastrum suecicum HHB10207 ss-3 TaxID=1314776 RepID=A0A166CM56_9AGAM|nr:hypothetical protein SISSUDRAFT_835014 [Sistotremastrum suecicum HHB10207 ss-3]